MIAMKKPRWIWLFYNNWFKYNCVISIISSLTKKVINHPWLSSYGSWIYNYLCNQCLSPLMWVWISIRVRCTTLCDKVCQWLATGQWFFPGTLVSSTNKTDCRDITEILLKVVLNTINQTQYHLVRSKEKYSIYR
jgi:hypothetical protein